jgi:hypothetical protein
MISQRLDEILERFYHKEIDMIELKKELLDLYKKTAEEQAELMLNVYKEGFNAATETLVGANAMIQQKKYKK